MELYLAAFEDYLFDNDETHFVSDAPMSQDDSSHATPSDSFANPNLTLASNKCKTVDVNDWVESNCQHLNASKRRDLARVLIKHPSLWDNKLGTYPGSKVHLELSNDATHSTFLPWIPSPICSPQTFQGRTRPPSVNQSS